MILFESWRLELLDAGYGAVSSIGLCRLKPTVDCLLDALRSSCILSWNQLDGAHGETGGRMAKKTSKNNKKTIKNKRSIKEHKNPKHKNAMNIHEWYSQLAMRCDIHGHHFPNTAICS